jgi:hypothetical protein
MKMENRVQHYFLEEEVEEEEEKEEVEEETRMEGEVEEVKKDEGSSQSRRLNTANCNMNNHSTENYRMPPKSSKRPHNTGDDIVCYHCMETGQVKKHCPVWK